MELTLPSKLNASETIVLDTNVLVVIGANGAGKSSFGRDLLERYSDNSKKISGMHSLFISSEEPVPVEGNELARLQSMNSRTHLHAPPFRIRKTDPPPAKRRI